MNKPRAVRLGGIEWDALTKRSQRAINTRIRVAELNVLAHAEDWMDVRKAAAGSRDGLRAEAEALADLIEAVGYLRKVQKIDGRDIELKQTPRRKKVPRRG